MSGLQRHNPVIGIGLVIFAGLCVTTMNMFVKLASETYSPIEIVFYRGLVLLAVLIPLIVLTGKTHLLKTKNPKIHFQRSLMGTISVLLVYWSYILLPMSDATALLMLSGLIVTALSMPFLGEKVGPIRWAAVVCGFCGALFLIKPTSESLIQVSSIVPLIGAFTIAAVALYLRGMSNKEQPLATILYFMVFSTTVGGLYLLFTIGLRTTHVGFIFVVFISLFACAQQFAKTYANQFADASTLSPYGYLTLVWSVFYDVVIWNDWPEMNVWVGSSIILASNFIVLWREHKLKRKSLI